MLTGIHFLLTLSCNFTCDHCFLHCRPGAGGTFTLARIRQALEQARELGSVETIYFEGGEPALFFPVLQEGIRLACAAGFTTGIVTNAYWALTEEDAELWLRPLMEAGLSQLRVSNDVFHWSSLDENPAHRALRAAEKLGLAAKALNAAVPAVRTDADGEKILDGDVMFRGRAVDKLTEGLPRRPARIFDSCPHEKLDDPGRIHLDGFGNMHLCQGLSMGNAWKAPLNEIARDYRAAGHPLCGPLVEGGPFRLAREYDVPLEDGYVDACHLCYCVRRALVDRFPDLLAPRLVYGMEG